MPRRHQRTDKTQTEPASSSAFLNVWQILAALVILLILVLWFRSCTRTTRSWR